MSQALMISESIICVLLIIFVLLQNKNVSLNLSNMGGGMDSVKKRGPEKVLDNATIVLGVLFVMNSLAFFYI